MNRNVQKQHAGVETISLSDSHGIITHRKIKILDVNQTLVAMFGYDLTELSEMTILDLIMPEVRSVVLRNTLIKYQKPYEAIGLRKDGTIFPIEITDEAVGDQDSGIRTMAIKTAASLRHPEEILESLNNDKDELQDKLNRTTTQLRYANERLRLEMDERTQMVEQLKIRARQQAAVAELGQRALAGTDIPLLINEAVSVAAQILGAEHAGLFELTPDRTMMRLAAGTGWQSRLTDQVTVDLNGDYPESYALLTNAPVILLDLQSETRFKQAWLLHDHHVVSGICLVLQGRAQPLGILSVYSTRRRRFTEDDLHFLQAIANVLASAIERRHTEEQIMASMQEKEALLKEIHDRVKNNLQIILSLLNLQSDLVADARAYEILKDVQSRVKSMALVHAKLYHSDNLARIDSGEYIRDMVAHLSRSYSVLAQGIQLDIQTDPILLPMDSAVPFGLILNEMITNSLKHAFPNGQKRREIRIRFRTNGDHQLHLSVADTGIGFPAELDFRATDSLGLQLVNTLVDQLDGTIELEHHDGTEFKIAFAPSSLN